MYSTTESFDTVDLVEESMPQDALKDLIWCMYFADNWDDKMGEWDSFYIDTKESSKDGTAQHQKKDGQLGDANNKRW